MNTFDPRDWRNARSWSRWNAERFQRSLPAQWLASVAFCLCFASLAPASALPAVLAALLSLAGAAWLVVALLAGEPPLARHLNGWDAALLCFLASFALQVAQHV